MQWKPTEHNETGVQLIYELHQKLCFSFGLNGPKKSDRNEMVLVLGMDDMVPHAPLLYTRLIDTGHCSLIKPAAMEKYTSVYTKIHTAI